MYIYLVQEKPCLWNKESAFFKNKTKRNAAMEELCENLEKSKTIEQVKAKFRILSPRVKKPPVRLEILEDT